MSKEVYIASFPQLVKDTQPIHLGNPIAIDGLHDIWKLGAPTPDSYIDPNRRGYDERKAQVGVSIRRIIFWIAWRNWASDVLQARGVPHTEAELHRYYLDMANGLIALLSSMYGYAPD